MTGEGEPEPFLAYETDAVVLEFPDGSSDPIDSMISLYLEKGFALVTKPLVPEVLPALAQWSVAIGNQAIAVTDEEGAVAFEASLGDVGQDWIEIVRTRDLCRVLTGTRLGIKETDFWPLLEKAVDAGRVVGATISIR
jgi:hypothetical protein